MELISRDSYRMHSASHGAQGRIVVVKVFEGPHAKQVLSTSNLLGQSIENYPGLYKKCGFSKGVPVS